MTGLLDRTPAAGEHDDHWGQAQAEQGAELGQSRLHGVLTGDQHDAPARLGQRCAEDGTTGVPMPTVAILDAGHVLRWIDVHPDYSTRTEPAQVLRALDQLGL